MRDRPPAVVLPIAFLLLVLPRAASAHAAFVSSEPEPGERLESAPGAVRLTFTEPLNAKLSRVDVVDPTGRSFATTSVADRAMSVRLETNAPGTYEVRWTTVSPLDGHTLRGSFQFGVGVTPAEGEEATGTGPGRTDLILALGRAVEYAGLLAAGGMLLLVALARREPRIHWVRQRLRVALVVTLIAGLGVVVGEAMVAAGALRLDALVDYVTGGTAGWARLARLGLEVSALALAFVGSMWTVAPLMLSLGALAAAGHAAALRPAWWGIAWDAGHLVSVSLWAGGIIALARLRPPSGWRGPEGQKLLERFTPVALYAFTLTIATGILRATQELSAPRDLVATSYGRVLAIKIAGVVAMVPLSLRAWRRVSGSVRGEAVVAVGVIGLAAVLAAYPLPPGRAVEAEEAETEAASSERAVPREGDLTLGGDAGQTLVGLTLRPGEPGTNEVLMFVLPVSGAEGARGVPVDIAGGAGKTRTTSCGLTCRRTTLRLDGGESLGVRVGGLEGGLATFEVPDLPTRGGEALLEAATSRMADLQSLRVEEVLEPTDPPVRTEYAFLAPDRMRLRSSNRFEVVSIGSNQYQRSPGSEEWRVSTDVPAIDAPLLTWSGFAPVAPRVVGTEEIAPGRATIVSFFSGDVENPIWFRLWITDDRLVHRMEMRALGHFMDQRLLGFDTPLRIEPPQ